MIQLMLSACRPVAVLALLLAVGGCARDPRPPRNLLLVTLDTLRADHLGAYGYPRPTSPRLDAFAGRATLFRDATCSMPTTLPSHLTIFTGLPPARHGVRRNGVPPERDLTSIFDLLATSGRRTAAVVAAGVLQERFLSGMGLEEIQAPDGTTVYQLGARQVVDRAAAWLDVHGDEPFALWLHFFDPHEPYAPPPELAARFTGGYRGSLGDALATDWLVSLNQTEVRDRLDAEDLRHVVDLYDAEIAFLDAQLGRLFELLEARRLAASTLVVIVGDHGQAHGENGFFGHGERLLEPVIRVPLLIRLPGQRRGRVVATPVETLDVLPTLAELFALASPPALPGRSLVAALRGDPLAPPAFRVVERREYPTAPERLGIAVLHGERKLVYYRDDAGESFHLGKRSGRGGLDGESFYVPGSADAELVAAWIAGRDQDTAAPALIADDTREMLRALGYIE